MEPQPEKQTNYTIPAAIIIAGLIVAGALIYTNKGSGSATSQNAPTGQTTSAALSLPAVSSDDHILGNPDAPFMIVEYSDTECPFCKQFHTTLHTIVDEYGKEGDVAWTYRHYPIVQLHSKAPREAEATECAAELGGNTAFWKYIDYIFEVTPSNNGLPEAELAKAAESAGLDTTAFSACLESGKYADKVATQVDEALEAGGRGTPFSILISKDTFNDTTLNLIASASKQFPPDTLVVSDDRKRIALNGALPLAFIRLLLNSALELDTSR